MNVFRIFTFILFFTAGGHLLAEAAPVEKLKSTVEGALDVLYLGDYQDLSESARQAKVRDIIESNYDLSVLIRRAMGRNWGLLNASEQEQVLDLVKRLILKAYFEGLEGRARPQVSFGATVDVASNRIEIPSTVVSDGEEYRVLYRLGRMESGWQIYDIVAEGISIVSNYRQQFDDHFRRGTAAGLISKLKDLLAQPELNEDFKL